MALHTRHQPNRARRIPEAATAAVAVCLALMLSATIDGRRRSSSASAQNSRKDSPSSETKAGVLRAVGSVGLILVSKAGSAPDPPRPRGSAVIIRKDGVVVTNLHVIAEDNSSSLYSELFLSLPDNGMQAQLAVRRYRLKPIIIKREYDLALLRVVSDLDGQPLAASEMLPAIELGDSSGVQLLDKVIVIGFPQGGGTSVTVNEGVIEGKDIVGNWIKTSARLIHGNSGGAAVDKEGRLIGIPTKVVIDKNLIPKSSRTAADGNAVYAAAAVGFLRPVQLVKSMLNHIDSSAQTGNSAKPEPAAPAASNPASPPNPAAGTVTVRGIVRAAENHRPIAGARVGLVPLGASDVTAANLIAWGGTNADGRFELNKPAPVGRYTLKVRALGYQDFMGDVNISQESVVVDLQRAARQ